MKNKKILAAVLSIVMVGTIVAGCGKVTYTTTVNGETTTEELSLEEAAERMKEDVSSMKEDAEAEESTESEASAESGDAEIHHLALTYINDSDVTVTGICLATSDSDDWGDPLSNDGFSLAPGESIDGYLDFNEEYTSWDYQFLLDDGDILELTGNDFSEFLDKDSAVVYLTGPEDDMYSLTIVESE